MGTVKIILTIGCLVLATWFVIRALGEAGVPVALDPYTFGELMFSLCLLPAVMFGLHKKYRPHFDFPHIGRELAWLAVAIGASVATIVLSSLSLDAIGVFVPIPREYRAYGMIMAGVVILFGTYLCEVYCRRIWDYDQLKKHHTLCQLYRAAVSTIGIGVYVIAVVVLVTRRH